MNLKSITVSVRLMQTKKKVKKQTKPKNDQDRRITLGEKFNKIKMATLPND